jgi:lipoyl(octanoyl) transferase
MKINPKATIPMANPPFLLLQQHPWWCVQFSENQPYERIYTLQLAIQKKVHLGLVPNIILLGSHPPTVTVGKKTDPTHIKTIPTHIPSFEIERGGSITYHYPQQAIVYPILKLPTPNVHGIARWLETSWIEAINLAASNPKGLQTLTGKAGLWTTDAEPQKLGALGLAVKQWITYHGIAINIAGDVSPFSHWMLACGLENTTITSLQAYYEAQHPFQTATQALAGWLAYLAVQQNTRPERTFTVAEFELNFL